MPTNLDTYLQANTLQNNYAAKHIITRFNDTENIVLFDEHATPFHCKHASLMKLQQIISLSIVIFLPRISTYYYVF